MFNNDIVYLECIKEGKKLRIKIITSGYDNNANCQSPRDIRVEGRRYEVPASAITVASIKSGKFFYRISKSSIKVIENDVIMPNKIYEGVDCCICISDPCVIVMVECGHLCMCKDCSDAYLGDICPMCREKIKLRINKDQLQ